MFNLFFAFMFTIQFFNFGFMVRQDGAKPRYDYLRTMLGTSILMAVMTLIWVIVMWVEWSAFPLYCLLIQGGITLFSFYMTKTARNFSNLLNNPNESQMINLDLQAD